MNREITVISIDTRRGNCIYENNAVRNKDMYPPELWEKLLAGEEIESDWDEKGRPIEWESMHDDEE